MRRQSDFRRATLVTHATNDVDVTTRTMLCRSTAISTERVARVHGQHRNVRNGGQGTGVLPSPMAARQSTINNIIVSDEAILSAENGGKPLGGRGSAPNPAGRAHSAPRPLAGGEGACCSSQGTPLPAVSLRTWPPIKNPGQALGTA